MIRFTTLVQQAGAIGHDRLTTGSWGSGHVFALCDGAGGIAGAGEAADLVSSHMVEIASAPRSRVGAVLVEALHDLDKSPALAAAAGQTTALVAVVANGLVEGVSVGDSEAWLVSDADDIALTADQNRKPLVGSRLCSAIAFGPVPMRGTLVLGSDGLFKYCPREKLLSIARSAELDLIPELLLRASQLPSGKLQDDFAVLVCRETA
jgi:PPM family protein phosphatase